MDEAVQERTPWVPSYRGFGSGTWSAGQAHAVGHALVVFQSQEQAAQMAGTVTGEPDEPFENVEAYDVVAEA